MGALPAAVGTPAGAGHAAGRTPSRLAASGAVNGAQVDPAPRHRRVPVLRAARGDQRRVADTLARFAVFAGCGARDVASVAVRGRLTTVPAGWSFITEGAPADACYVIVAGSARVLRAGRHVADVGRGDVVGEVGVARPALRNATVSARTPVTLLHLTAEHVWGVSPLARQALFAQVDTRSASSVGDAARVPAAASCGPVS